MDEASLDARGIFGGERSLLAYAAYLGCEPEELLEEPDEGEQLTLWTEGDVALARAA